MTRSRSLALDPASVVWVPLLRLRWYRDRKRDDRNDEPRPSTPKDTP